MRTNVVEAEPYIELRREEVGRRAYRLWKAAGRPAHRHLEFWLQAELELLSERLQDRLSPEILAEAA